jgi:hypothetical protein
MGVLLDNWIGINKEKNQGRKKWIYHSKLQCSSLDQLVSKNHQYRKFLFNFRLVERKFLSVESSAPYKGYGVLRLFKCLLLQFIVDIQSGLINKVAYDPC